MKNKVDEIKRDCIQKWKKYKGYLLLTGLLFFLIAVSLLFEGLKDIPFGLGERVLITLIVWPALFVVYQLLESLLYGEYISTSKYYNVKPQNKYHYLEYIQRLLYTVSVLLTLGSVIIVFIPNIDEGFSVSDSI